MIGFRQQHDYTGAHGRSDLYVMCRLVPIDFEINACSHEIKACEWMDIDVMCNYEGNRLSQLAAKLIKYGVENGFDKIDIMPKHMHSIFPGRTFNFFFRNVPGL